MLKIAVSSRALFNLDEANAVWETQGPEAYEQFQRARADEVLEPGPAYNLVKKLLALNNPELWPERDKVEVIMLSRNTPATGRRIMRSITAHGLAIGSGMFVEGCDRFPFAAAFDAHLFLTASEADVKQSIKNGLPAALIKTGKSYPIDSTEIRIAFDGDGVLWNDSAERVSAHDGLRAFRAHEIENAAIPMGDGPMTRLMRALHELQASYPTAECPVRIYLVTARGVEASERAMVTLDALGLRLDGSLFLDGKPKGVFLKALKVDLFFDDTPRQVDSAAEHVPTGHVLDGIRNELDSRVTSVPPLRRSAHG